MDEQQTTGTEEATAEETSTEQTAETTTETTEEGSKETEKKPEESQKQEEEETPPTRKTKFDYILERKQKQLDKLREEKTQKVDEELKNHGVEEEEISTDDEKLVEKVVQKRFGQYFTEADERSAEAELQDFFNTDPLGKYFKESEAKIRQWSRHPSRANLPLRAVALEVYGDKLLEVGARLEREAAKKAAGSQTGGGKARNVEGKVDWANMSAEDFAKEKEKVMRGK